MRKRGIRKEWRQKWQISDGGSAEEEQDFYFEAFTVFLWDVYIISIGIITLIYHHIKFNVTLYVNVCVASLISSAEKQKKRFGGKADALSITLYFEHLIFCLSAFYFESTCSDRLILRRPWGLNIIITSLTKCTTSLALAFRQASFFSASLLCPSQHFMLSNWWSILLSLLRVSYEAAECWALRATVGGTFQDLFTKL